MPSKPAPDRKLVELAFRIKPLMKDGDGMLHFIKSPDIYRIPLDSDITQGSAARQMKRLTELKVELPVGMYDLRFPTVAQVLSQLPKRYHKTATAYTVAVNDGFLSGEEGCVNATVTLYKGALPKTVAEETITAMGQKFRHPSTVKPVFNPAAAVTAEKPITVMKPLTFKKPDGPQP
jgi:hypothetical protein